MLFADLEGGPINDVDDDDDDEVESVGEELLLALLEVVEVLVEEVDPELLVD